MKRATKLLRDRFERRLKAEIAELKAALRPIFDAPLWVTREPPDDLHWWGAPSFFVAWPTTQTRNARPDRGVAWTPEVGWISEGEVNDGGRFTLIGSKWWRGPSAATVSEALAFVGEGISDLAADAAKDASTAAFYFATDKRDATALLRSERLADGWAWPGWAEPSKPSGWWALTMLRAMLAKVQAEEAELISRAYAVDAGLQLLEHPSLPGDVTPVEAWAWAEEASQRAERAGQVVLLTWEGEGSDRTLLRASLSDAAPEPAHTDPSSLGMDAHPSKPLANAPSGLAPPASGMFSIPGRNVALLYRAERELAPLSAFQLPAPLMIGAGPGPYFGGQKRHLGEVSRVGRGVIRIISERSQMDFIRPESLEGSPDELLPLIERMLSNRTFRVLCACFLQSQEDERKGIPTGAFLYSPTRTADDLGFKREKNGKTDRQPESVRTKMDIAMQELALTRFEGRIPIGGKDQRVSAQGLVRPQGVTIEELGEKKGRGRRQAVLIRLSDALLMMLGGAWFPVPRHALKPPPGVTQETWDDAFKVLSVLMSHARFNASKGPQWDRKIETLLEVANIHGPAQRPGRVRERLTGKLLPALAKAGLIRWEVDGGRVLYRLPGETGAALGTIRPRKRLTRSKKATDLSAH